MAIMSYYLQWQSDKNIWKKVTKRTFISPVLHGIKFIMSNPINIYSKLWPAHCTTNTQLYRPFGLHNTSVKKKKSSNNRGANTFFFKKQGLFLYSKTARTVPLYSWRKGFIFDETIHGFIPMSLLGQFCNFLYCSNYAAWKHERHTN